MFSMPPFRLFQKYLLTHHLYIFAEFYVACAFQLPIEKSLHAGVDHRWFFVGPDRRGQAISKIAADAAAKYLLILPTNILRIGDVNGMLKMIPENPVVAGFSMEFAVLRAIETFGVKSIFLDGKYRHQGDVRF